MDLSTEYLGLRLRSPLVASASPLSESLDRIRRLEDAGIAAVVLPSLFEEDLGAGEALDCYLDLVRSAKDSARVPIIASLGGVTPEGWESCARQIAQAGPDALELNLYYLPRSLDRSGADLEDEYIRTFEAIRAVVSLPLAVKLGPYFTNLCHFARRLDRAGADALVLFNRFYQPDLDLENGRVFPHLLLSTQSDLRLPLRWIGLLHGRLDLDFAATGGIQTDYDALKTVAVGAHVAMLCSVLLKGGLEQVRIMEEGMRAWMEACEYGSIASLRGSLSHARSSHPEAFERAQYVATLRGLTPDALA